MAVAFDAVGPSSAGAGAAGVSGAGALTWSHTCTGSQLLLLVGVGVGGAISDGNTVAVTYNGVSMTDCGAGKIHTNAGTLGFVQLFYLIAPATGANTVSINSGAAAGDVTGGSISF